MKYMLLALVILVLGLAWTPNIMAQGLSCSASNNVIVIPAPTTVHTGDEIVWTISIQNNSQQNDSPFAKVPAKLVADGSDALHPPLEMTMAVGRPGTFTFINCTDLTAGMDHCALKAGDSNIVLLYTTPTGVSFGVDEVNTPHATITLGKVHATAVTPVPTPSHVAVTNIAGAYDAGEAKGVFETTGTLCEPQVDSGAQGTTTETFPPRPCIHVTKSVEPLKSKPTDSVTYTIEVCNCGDIDLTGITVTDTKLGNLVPPFPSTLAKGTVGNPNCVTKNIPWTIPQGTTEDPYVNMVTVNSNETAASCFDCTGASCVDCTKTASASVDLFIPNVTISKDCKCNPRDPSIGCQANDSVDYTITVHNLSTSDTPTITCRVTDSLLSVDKSFTWNTSSGQVNTTNKPRVFQDSDPDCLDNTANLHCTIAGFPNVINKNASCEVCKNTPTSSGGEEPFKAAVADDKHIPGFYISPKLNLFTHPDTDYYSTCTDLFPLGDPRIDISVCKPVPPTYLSYECPATCREKFTYQASAVDQPEVCCKYETVYTDFASVAEDRLVLCPDHLATPTTPNDGEVGPVKTAMISKGNSGWYEWVIALPKKPVDELNIEIECGVLKPNTWQFWEYESIEKCAAITGEIVAPGSGCTRVSGSALKTSALPRLEVTAHPGCRHPNTFTPFHLTSYRNPSVYSVTRATDPQCPPGIKCLNNSASMQILDGTVGTRIALKACMDKTILVKLPVEGEINELGEEEAALEPGDLIKVRMAIPTANTVDVYCSKYSVTIGGIGIPASLLKDDPQICPCINSAVCTLDKL
jgi:hypothetical protein